MGEIGEKGMYQFDESFLDSVGLSGMPEEQKKTFLQYAQDQLEVRIGEKMSEGLSDDQLDEFERIIDNDQETVQKWLAEIGDYKNDETYVKLSENSEEDIDSPEFLADYVTAKWLDKNCPQYQDIIKESLESLQAEISSQKEEILANA
jgi:protein-tyrosine-phosphatase